MKRKITKFLLLGAFLMMGSRLYAKSIYVNANNAAALTKDGTSWTNAYVILQDALDIAVSGDIIYVAKGTYKPSFAFADGVTSVGVIGPDNRYNTFRLPSNVTIYGGYDDLGTGTRNILLNETILSGDLGIQDDKNDNAYNVVMLTNGTTGVTLDGFTITKGFADGNGANINRSIGGATHPPYHGGGIFLRNSDGVFKNLKIIENSLKAQTATSYGGGFFMAVTNSNSVELDNIEFIENEALSDGTRQATAGALFMQGSNNIKLNRLKFISNTADFHGGAISGSLGATSYTLTNSIFYNNTAGNMGGAMFVSDGGNSVDVIVNIVNCTFYANKSSTAGAGGAIHLSNASKVNVSLKNSILNANTAMGVSADIVKPTNAILFLANSITQTYGSDGVSGVKVGVEPLFLSTVYGNADFLKLKPLSLNPAINAGNNAYIPAGIFTDLSGVVRQNGTVDLGAYENYLTLPINLTNFSAKVNLNSVLLNWTTTSETDNDYFLIEKSGDGKIFVKLNTVSSKNANGASYNLADINPENGLNYYRLTQIDKDGTRKVFDVITVNFSFSKNASIRVYPNPILNGIANFTFQKSKFTLLNVVDIYGNKLLTKTIDKTENQKAIDMSTYPKGIYFVNLVGANESVTTKILN